MTPCWSVLYPSGQLILFAPFVRELLETSHLRAQTPSMPPRIDRNKFLQCYSVPNILGSFGVTTADARLEFEGVTGVYEGSAPMVLPAYNRSDVSREGNSRLSFYASRSSAVYKADVSTVQPSSMRALVLIRSY